jgi:DNA-binding transcriptional LysR family regulator
MNWMGLSRFDLNLLIALHALLNEKNVTRAAERVFLSQPAMSAALSKLRDYFNDPLLVRVGRKLELTARGLALVEPVREMLMHAQLVLGTPPVFDATVAQRLFSIMVPDYVVPLLIPRLLQRLNRFAPGIQIQVNSWMPSGPSRVVNGEIDLLVAPETSRVAGVPNHLGLLCSAPLQTVRWVCAVARENPLVQQELTREQFLGLPHVYVRYQGDMQPAEEVARQQLHVKLDIRVTTDNVLEIPFMLPGTQLLAIIPESIARLLTPCLALRIIEIPSGILEPRRLSLYWHRRNGADAGHLWLRSAMLDFAIKA